jgi:hypothetical protein
MGHVRMAGLVSEATIAGHGFLRIDVPKADGLLTDWVATQYFNPSSVYRMTPVTEAIARKVAADNQPRPATRWELEAREAVTHDREDEDDYR